MRSNAFKKASWTASSASAESRKYQMGHAVGPALQALDDLFVRVAGRQAIAGGQ